MLIWEVAAPAMSSSSAIHCGQGAGQGACVAGQVRHLGLAALCCWAQEAQLASAAHSTQHPPARGHPPFQHTHNQHHTVHTR